MTQIYHFSKFHGLGNDFIIIDGVNQRVPIDIFESEIPLLCHRNFGIGGDGVILALHSETCDIKMKIFNSDGSCPEMCGNGLRCFAQFVYEQKLVDSEIFSVETDAGKMVPALLTKDGVIEAIEVDMGAPQHDSAIMPDQTLIHHLSVDMQGKSIAITVVSMGNPHAVIFVDSFDDILIDEIGPWLQTHSLFPQGVNVELVQVLDKSHGKCVVWERGSGKTLACGTGACAAVVAGGHLGKFERNVMMDLPGGRLAIEWQASDNHVIKTGPATAVFSGQVIL